MAVERKQIPITSPCPIELDRSGVAAGDRQLHCAHCTKDVHLISQMTEPEARDLFRQRAGEDICVSYALRPDGQIRFRPEPALVAPASLVRSPTTRRMSMAASIGAAALLSACTPHTDPNPELADEVEVTVPREIEAPPEEVVAGGMVAEPLPEQLEQPEQPEQPCDPEDDIQVDGGLKAMPIDEIPPEPDAEPLPMARPEPHMAGGLRAHPIDDGVLGLIDRATQEPKPKP